VDRGRLPAGALPAALAALALGNLGALLAGHRGRERQARPPRREPDGRGAGDGSALWSAIGWSAVHLLFLALIVAGTFVTHPFFGTQGADLTQQLNPAIDGQVAPFPPAHLVPKGVPPCTSGAVAATLAAVSPAAARITIRLSNSSEASCRLGAVATVVAVGGAAPVAAAPTPPRPTNSIGPVLAPGDGATALLTARCADARGGGRGFKALSIRWAGGSARATLPPASFLTAGGSGCVLSVSALVWSSGG